MRGLLLNNFYSAWHNLRALGLVILLLGAVVVIFGDSNAVELFPYISISIFAVSGVATMREDATSQWNKYELTLPLKRNQIIRCKYATYMILALIGLAVSVIVTALTFSTHGVLFTYGLRDAISLFSLGMGLAIMTGSIFFPMSVAFGADKSEVLLFMSVFISVTLSMVFIRIVNKFDWVYAARLTLFNLAYIVTFVVSYAITCKLYAKKEL